MPSVTFCPAEHSFPFRWHQVLLLGDSDTCIRAACPGSYLDVGETRTGDLSITSLMLYHRTTDGRQKTKTVKPMRP